MSWLEGKWTQQFAGNDSVLMPAVPTEIVVGVQYSAAADGSKDATGWLVEGYQQELADWRNDALMDDEEKIIELRSRKRRKERIVLFRKLSQYLLIGSVVGAILMIACFVLSMVFYVLAHRSGRSPRP
jgi:hypothetical protein